MKILFVTSFYSLLERSVKDDKWEPEGMPAVAKLFEGLKQQGIYFDSIMIDRKLSSNTTICKYNNSHFGNNFFLVLPKKTKHIFKLKPLKKMWSLFMEISYFNVTRKLINDVGYDVVYIDRANTIIAWFVSLFCKTPVFIRYHGVVLLERTFSKIRNRFLHPLRYMSLFGNYAYILCSLDGSPTKSVLERFRKKNVKYKIMLNGVDPVEILLGEQKQVILKELGIRKDVPILLFTGRLIGYKGIKPFLETIKRVHSKSVAFHVIIVGSGELYEWAEGFIRDNQLEPIVSLIGQVAHDQMQRYLGIADIYISLNQLGNLSNTVLEALSAGLATIVLKNSAQNSHDTALDILEQSVIYVNRDNIIEELEEVINNLLLNPKLITEYKNKSKALAKGRLVSWEKRIEKEIELIRKVAIP